MKQKRQIFAALSLLIACSQNIEARIWTLQECIDYALSHNISLQQARLRVLQSHENVSQSKAALFPSVSFNTNQNGSYRPFSASTINLTNGSMTTVSNKVSYNGSYGINANWTVWNWNKNRMAIKQNKMQEQMDDLSAQQQANTIQEQIAQLYIQILYETEAVRVNEEIVKASQMQADRAKTMVEVGQLARVDQVQLEAQVDQDKYSLISAQSQLANYKLQLKQLLEIHDDEPFDVAVPQASDAVVMSTIPNKESIYIAALATRPEILSAAVGIKQSEVAVKSARTGYLPTLSLNAGIGSSNSSGQHTGFGQQIKTNFSNSLGLTLSVPIFDQLQTRTTLRRAKLTLQDNQLALIDKQKTLYSSVEKYWLDATSSQQQYIYAKKNRESMQESYNLVSEQFNCGLKNIVELTTGKNNLLQAEQQLLQTKYTSMLNQALLKFYGGEPINL